ncbi:cuticle protein 19-like [Portunus trituberculatus]|uniref:cuticle protein 19-like n=1 Tax=Portunus trituberculatus TaxID=210409 RepID=UPI001E1D160C|nr:cuticle protein 19-like [Portunus trituberculatus]
MHDSHVHHNFHHHHHHCTMAAKVLLLMALMAAAAADRRPHSHEISYGSFESDEPKYDFNYHVNDYYGNNFGHQENRDGDYTRGEYFTLLPDGRKQTVKYVVDGYSGFLADVSYEGEARYDSGSHESYRPRYDSEPREFFRRRDSDSREFNRPIRRFGYRGSDEY